jgi:hypothetical protein
MAVENTVKQGKTNKNIYWIGYKAYQILPNNQLLFAGGGICDDTETELVRTFILRNKKAYQIYENVAVREYNELIPIGKYKSLSVSAVLKIDKKYLDWMLREYNFSGKEGLKNEITECLKN